MRNIFNFSFSTSHSSRVKKAALFLLVAVLFTACRYEEGPGMSFYSPEKRLVGYWSLQKVFKNGEPVSAGEYQADKPGNYYAFYNNKTLSVTTLTASGEVRDSHSGFWHFSDNKNKLNLDFTLLSRHYLYTADIKKLTRNELRYEYVDENGVTWKLEFGSRSY